MRLDLDHLDALAQRATPGPWACKLVYESQRGSPDYAHIQALSTNVPVSSCNGREEDAAFIAAVSPDVISSLIRRLRAAECVVEIVRSGLRDEDFQEWDYWKNESECANAVTAYGKEVDG